jgi:hypothetical protein
MSKKNFVAAFVAAFALLAPGSAWALSWSGPQTTYTWHAISSGWGLEGAHATCGSDYPVSQHTTGWNRVTGACALYITTDHTGNAWIVTAANNMYYWNGSSFTLFDNHTKTWIWAAAGTPKNPYEIWAIDSSNKVWNNNGTETSPGTWVQITGISGIQVVPFLETQTCGAHSIHTAWVIDSSNKVYYYTVGSACNNGSFTQQTGASAKYLTVENIVDSSTGSLYIWKQASSAFSFIIAKINSNGTAAVGSLGADLSSPSGTWGLDGTGNLYVLQ